MMLAAELAALSVPVVSRALLSGLFVLTSVQKVVSFETFVAAISAYQLVPNKMARFAAFGLVACEATLAVWLLVGWPSLGIAALVSVLLLLLFAGAMAVNLARRRYWISCGCFGTPGSRISWFLVARNILLCIPAATIGEQSGLDRIQPLRCGVSTLSGIVLLVFVVTGSSLLSLATEMRAYESSEKVQL